MSNTQNPERFTLDTLAEHAKAIALEQEHLPTVIAKGRENAVVGQIPEFPNTAEGRLQFMYVAGYLFGKQGMIDTLEEVFIVMEAWMSVRAKDDDLQVRPSEDPQALEVLLISAFNLATQTTDFRIFEIISAAGKRVELKPQFAPADKIHAHNPLLEMFVTGFAVGSAAQT